jgi:hypothetical protein
MARKEDNNKIVQAMFLKCENKEDSNFMNNTSGTRKKWKMDKRNFKNSN